MQLQHADAPAQPYSCRFKPCARKFVHESNRKTHEQNVHLRMFRYRCTFKNRDDEPACEYKSYFGNIVLSHIRAVHFNIRCHDQKNMSQEDLARSKAFAVKI